MIDYACIKVKAGDGGRGAGSFMHIKGKRLGKADGGDGAKGGDVYLVATRDLNTLEPFRYIKDYKAADGRNGGAQKRRGAQGEDLEIKVPVGTQVKIGKLGKLSESENSADQNVRISGKSDNLKYRKTESSEYSDHTFDLTAESQKILVALGGAGGRGNAHLRDEYRRRPKSGEKGEVGENVEVTLELKLIADVGLIGLPNAGKSTLLSKLTSATPKIADYPFTTLEPNLGVLRQLGDLAIGKLGQKTQEPKDPITQKPRQLVLADIPGLIEGASAGKGLGDLFLRHIERTKILVHLIDVTADDLWSDYQTIRNELKAYSKELAKKKEIIVLNKIDLVNKESLNKAISVFKSHRKKVLVVSASSEQGIDLLENEIIKSIQKYTVK